MASCEDPRGCFLTVLHFQCDCETALPCQPPVTHHSSCAGGIEEISCANSNLTNTKHTPSKCPYCSVTEAIRHKKCKELGDFKHKKWSEFCEIMAKKALPYKTKPYETPEYEQFKMVYNTIELYREAVERDNLIRKTIFTKVDKIIDRYVENVRIIDRLAWVRKMRTEVADIRAGIRAEHEKVLARKEAAAAEKIREEKRIERTIEHAATTLRATCQEVVVEIKILDEKIAAAKKLAVEMANCPQCQKEYLQRKAIVQSEDNTDAVIEVPPSEQALEQEEFTEAASSKDELTDVLTEEYVTDADLREEYLAEDEITEEDSAKEDSTEGQLTQNEAHDQVSVDYVSEEQTEEFTENDLSDETINDQVPTDNVVEADMDHQTDDYLTEDSYDDHTSTDDASEDLTERKLTEQHLAAVYLTEEYSSEEATDDLTSTDDDSWHEVEESPTEGYSTQDAAENQAPSNNQVSFHDQDSFDDQSSVEDDSEDDMEATITGLETTLDDAVNDAVTPQAIRMEENPAEQLKKVADDEKRDSDWEELGGYEGSESGRGSSDDGWAVL